MSSNKQKAQVPSDAYERVFSLRIRGALRRSQQDIADEKQRKLIAQRRTELDAYLQQEEQNRKEREDKLQAMIAQIQQEAAQAVAADPKAAAAAAKKPAQPNATQAKKDADPKAAAAAAAAAEKERNDTYEKLGTAPPEKAYLFSVEFQGEKRVTKQIFEGDFDHAFEEFKVTIPDINAAMAFAEQAVVAQLWRVNRVIEEPQQPEEQSQQQDSKTAGGKDAASKQKAAAQGGKVGAAAGGNKNQPPAVPTIEGELISQFSLPCIGFFARDRLVLQKKWSSVANLAQLNLSVTLDSPLLSDTFDEKLRPMVISIQSLCDIPVCKFDSLCKPLYLQFRFASRMFSIPVQLDWSKIDPSATKTTVELDNQQVIFMNHGDLNIDQVRRILEHDPLQVEVHDRDPVDSAIKVINYGLATFNLGDLVCCSGHGQKSLKLCEAVRGAQHVIHEEPAPAPEQPAAKAGAKPAAAGKSKDKTETPVPEVPALPQEIKKALPPSNYIECGTHLVIKFRLSRPFPKADTSLHKLAVVLRMHQHNTELFDLVEQFMFKYNNPEPKDQPQPEASPAPAAAKGKQAAEQTSTQEAEAAEKAIQMADKLFGFSVIDGERRIVFVEGLAERGIRALVKELESYIESTEDEGDTLIMHSPDDKYFAHLIRDLFAAELAALEKPAEAAAAPAKQGSKAAANVPVQPPEPPKPLQLLKKIRLNRSLESILNRDLEQLSQEEAQIVHYYHEINALFMDNIWRIRQEGMSLKNVKICVAETRKLFELVRQIQLPALEGLESLLQRDQHLEKTASRRARPLLRKSIRRKLQSLDLIMRYVGPLNQSAMNIDFLTYKAHEQRQSIIKFTSAIDAFHEMLIIEFKRLLSAAEDDKRRSNQATPRVPSQQDQQGQQAPAPVPTPSSASATPDPASASATPQPQPVASSLLDPVAVIKANFEASKENNLVTGAVRKLAHACVAESMKEVWHNGLFPTAAELSALEKHFSDQSLLESDVQDALAYKERRRQEMLEMEEEQRRLEEEERLRIERENAVPEFVEKTSDMRYHVGRVIELEGIPLKSLPIGLRPSREYIIDGEEQRRRELVDQARHITATRGLSVPEEKLDLWTKFVKMYCFVPQLNDCVLLAFEPELEFVKAQIERFDSRNNADSRTSTPRHAKGTRMHDVIGYADTTILADATIARPTFAPRIRDKSNPLLPERNIRNWITGTVAVAHLPTGNDQQRFCILVSKCKTISSSQLDNRLESKYILHKTDQSMLSDESQPQQQERDFYADNIHFIRQKSRQNTRQKKRNKQQIMESGTLQFTEEDLQTVKRTTQEQVRARRKAKTARARSQRDKNQSEDSLQLQDEEPVYQYSGQKLNTRAMQVEAMRKAMERDPSHSFSFSQLPYYTMALSPAGDVQNIGVTGLREEKIDPNKPRWIAIGHKTSLEANAHPKALDPARVDYMRQNPFDDKQYYAVYSSKLGADPDKKPFNTLAVYQTRDSFGSPLEKRDRELFQLLKSLVVHGLKKNGPVDEKDLRYHFGQYGVVRNMSIDWTRGEGLVQFGSHEEAESVVRSSIDGKFIVNGLLLQVTWSKPSRDDLEKVKTMREREQEKLQKLNSIAEDAWRQRLREEEKEKWEQKLIVDDANFHVDMKGATNKTQSLLLDPPKKHVLKYTATGSIPLDVVGTEAPYSDVQQRRFSKIRSMMTTPTDLKIPVGKVERVGTFYLYSKQKEGLGTTPLYKRPIQPLRTEERKDPRFG